MSNITDFTGENCGDALGNYLRTTKGYELPKGGIGPGEVAELGKSNGAPVYNKNNISVDNLTPGTIIHLTRQPGDKNYEYGKTHIGIVDNSEKGLVFRSYTAGKGWRTEVVNENFINRLPSSIVATNPDGEQEPESEYQKEIKAIINSQQAKEKDPNYENKLAWKNKVESLKYGDSEENINVVQEPQKNNSLLTSVGNLVSPGQAIAAEPNVVQQPELTPAQEFQKKATGLVQQNDQTPVPIQEPTTITNTEPIALPNPTSLEPGSLNYVTQNVPDEISNPGLYQSLLKDREPKISTEINKGETLPVTDEEDKMGFWADSFLWGLTIPGDVAVGAAVAGVTTPLLGAAGPVLGSMAGAAAAGAQHQIMREGIEYVDGTRAPRHNISTKLAKEITPDWAKPYLDGIGGRIAGSAVDMAALGQILKYTLKYPGKGYAQALGDVAKLADKYISQPLAKLGEKTWKPATDYLINEFWVEPIKMGQDVVGSTAGEDLIGRALKFAKEKIQPAAERLRNNPLMDGVVDLLNKSRANRNIERTYGNELAEQLNSLLPHERFEFIRAKGKGEIPSSPKVKEILTKWNDFNDNNLNATFVSEFDKLYGKFIHQPFNKIKSSNLDLMEEIYKTQYEPAMTKQTPKAINKLLDKIITDPTLPLEFRQVSTAIYNLQYNTPIGIGRASNHGMRQMLLGDILGQPNVTAVKAGGDYVESTWRDLKGLNIHKDVELELHSWDELFKPAKNWYEKYMLPMWKTNMVVLRPAAWGRNVITNMLIQDAKGLPWYRGDIYQKAWSEIRNGSSGYKAWAREGAYADVFTKEDMGPLANFPKHGESGFEMALRLYNSVAEVPRNYYGLTEQWSKYAKYLHNIETGMPHKDAMVDSINSVYNYGEKTPFIQKVGKSPYGMPFVTWWSKVIPDGLTTMVQHPLRMAKWYGLFQLWQGHALEQTGVTEEEWQRLNKDFTGYTKGGMYALMPWRDEKDNLKMLNLSWLLPTVGDINQMQNQAMENPFALLFQGPVVSNLATLLSKTQRTGAPLFYDWQDPSVKVMNCFSTIWRSMVPSLMPGGVDYKMIKDAWDKRPDSVTSEEAAAAQVGIRLMTVNPRNVRRMHNAMNLIAESQLGSYTRTQLRKALPEEKEDILADQRRMIKKIYKRGEKEQPEESMFDIIRSINENRK